MKKLIISIVQSDNGLEFKNKQYKIFCEKKKLKLFILNQKKINYNIIPFNINTKVLISSYYKKLIIPLI